MLSRREPVIAMLLTSSDDSGENYECLGRSASLSICKKVFINYIYQQGKTEGHIGLLHSVILSQLIKFGCHLLHWSCVVFLHGNALR